MFVETDFNISPVNGSTGVFVGARVQNGGGCGAENARGIFFHASPGKYVLNHFMSKLLSLNDKINKYCSGNLHTQTN